MSTAPQPLASDRRPVNVLWLTSGLGCDGESVALTGATSPSLEDLLRGCLPVMPPMVLHNALLAYENGDEFMRVWWEAAAGTMLTLSVAVRAWPSSDASARASAAMRRSTPFSFFWIASACAIVGALASSLRSDAASAW